MITSNYSNMLDFRKGINKPVPYRGRPGTIQEVPWQQQLFSRQRVLNGAAAVPWTGSQAQLPATGRQFGQGPPMANWVGTEASDDYIYRALYTHSWTHLLHCNFHWLSGTHLTHSCLLFYWVDFAQVKVQYFYRLRWSSHIDWTSGGV